MRFGAWLGWQALPIIIIVSSVVGAIIGIVMIALSKQERAQPMPFGPFLAAAGWIVLVGIADPLFSYLFPPSGL